MARSTPSSPDCSGTCRCGQTRGWASASQSRRLRWLTSIDERRTRARPSSSAERAEDVGQLRALLGVAVQPEVDARHDELAVPLGDAPARLVEHGAQRTRATRAAHLRDHAERAPERAAVLHLDERARAVETRLGADAGGRAELARDALGRLLRGLAHDGDARVRGAERVGAEARRAARDVDVPGAPAERGAHGLAALGHGLVRDAAGVDDVHRPALARLLEPAGQQPLAHALHVGLRDLAAQELDREAHAAASRSSSSPSQPVQRPALRDPVSRNRERLAREQARDDQARRQIGAPGAAPRSGASCRFASHSAMAFGSSS